MKFSKQALTIHLYCYEEVLASLEWTIVHGRFSEAVYWAIELYDSEMLADIPELLGNVWAQHIGFGNSGLTTLEEICKMQNSLEIDRDYFINCIYSWSRMKTMNAVDSSAFYLLVLGGITPINWAIRYPHKDEYITVESALEDTLRRGKTKEAWLISRAIDPELQWNIIVSHAERQGRLNELNMIKSLTCDSDAIRRAAAYILLTISEDTLAIAKAEPRRTALPSELTAAIEEWDSETSLKKRRTLKIRPEAITYKCSRSYMGVSETNMSDIHEDLLTNLKASPYWLDALSQFQDNGEWNCDRLKELFYETYFPYLIDDIPDEWPLNKKELSHGRGLSKKKETAIRHYICNMLRGRPCLAIYDISNLGADVIPNSLEWDDLYNELLDGCSNSLKSKLPMIPLKKVFECI